MLSNIPRDLFRYTQLIHCHVYTNFTFCNIHYTIRLHGSVLRYFCRFISCKQITGLLSVSERIILITDEIHGPGTMLITCESLSYPRRSSSFVGQNSLPYLHDSVFIRIYWAILFHPTLLHPVSLIHILLRHFPALHKMSFAGVLIDNLHKTSIIVYIISRVNLVVWVLFNILLN